MIVKQPACHLLVARKDGPGHTEAFGYPAPLTTIQKGPALLEALIDVPDVVDLDRKVG